MEIYIRRNKEEFGPFSREMALEYLKQGVFKTSDRACYVGVDEWKTVGELLSISVSIKPGHTAELTQTDKITEFNPAWTPPPERFIPPPQRAGLARKLLIALNVVLIMIAVTVASIRFIGGPELSERCVASVSVALSRFSTALSGPDTTPAPAAQKASEPASPPAPVATSPVATPPPAPAASAAVVAESPAPTTAAPAATPDMVAATSAPPDTAAAPDMAAASVPIPTSTPAPPKPFDPADLQANPATWPKSLTLKQPVVFPAIYNGHFVGSLTVPAGTSVHLIKIQGDQLVLSFNGGAQTVPWQWTDLKERASHGDAAPPPPSLPGPAATPEGP